MEFELVVPFEAEAVVVGAVVVAIFKNESWSAAATTSRASTTGMTGPLC